MKLVGGSMGQKVAVVGYYPIIDDSGNKLRDESKTERVTVYLTKIDKQRLENLANEPGWSMVSQALRLIRKGLDK